MHSALIALGFKLGDMPMWLRFLHSKAGLTLASLALGLIGTLGFAPYQFWIITLITLGFEFCLVRSLTTSKQVFWSLWIYFTALNAATLSWLNFVMHGFGEMPLPLSWLLEIVLSAYLALFHGLLGSLAFKFAHRRLKPETPKSEPQDDLDDYEDEDEDKDEVNAASVSHANSVDSIASARNVASIENKDKVGSVGSAGQMVSGAQAHAAPSQADLHATAHPTDTSEDSKQSQTLNAHLKGIQESAQALKATAQSLQYKAQAQANEPTSHKASPNADLKASYSKKGSTTPPKMGPLHFYDNVFLLCFLPVALILADYITGWMFTGFPWMYIGYTAIEGPFSAYAPLLGVRGITLVLFVCAGALALTLKRKYVYLPVAGVLFAIGIFCQGLSFTQPLPAIKVTGIQGNIAQQVKWEPRQVMPTISRYVNQTMPYFEHSDLIIWPESALPVFAQEIEPILADLNTIAYHAHTPLLTGIQHLRFLSKQEIESFNSIYLMGTSPELKDVQIYNKRQLVPFGEKVPFESVTRKLGSIFNFPMSGFTAGQAEQQQLELTFTQTHASPEYKTTTVGKTNQLSTKQPQASNNKQQQTSVAATTNQAASDTAHGTKQDTLASSAKPDIQANGSTNLAAPASLAEPNTPANDSTNLADYAHEANLTGSAHEAKVVDSDSTKLLADSTNSESAADATNSSADAAGSNNLVSDTTVNEIVSAEEDLISQNAKSKANAEPKLPSTVAANEDVDLFIEPSMADTGVRQELALENEFGPGQELAPGEKDWFDSAIPTFPQDVATPLTEPMTLKFIPAICYESIFPELMTSLHDESTNGIIMISNDSWFGNTRGPEEHLAIARMRAMEMQKPMIRVTNSGYTAIINERGFIINIVPQDKIAILHTDFVPNVGMTPYVRFNNIPLYMILIAMVLLGCYLRKQEINHLKQNLEALVRP